MNSRHKRILSQASLITKTIVDAKLKSASDENAKLKAENEKLKSNNAKSLKFLQFQRNALLSAICELDSLVGGTADWELELRPIIDRVLSEVAK